MVHEQSRASPRSIPELALPYFVPPAEAYTVHYPGPVPWFNLIIRFPYNTEPLNHLKLSFSLPTAYQHEPWDCGNLQIGKENASTRDKLQSIRD